MGSPQTPLRNRPGVLRRAKRRLALFALLFVLALVSAADSNSELKVRVVRLAGPVEVLHAGETERAPVALGEQLIAGDTLSIGKGGKVQLRFPGNVLVLLKENSTLRLSVLEPESRMKSVLSAGSLIANLQEALSPGATFEVETPTALAIVRGTVFEIEIVEPEDEAAPPAVKFYGYEGEVEVQFAEEVLKLGPGVLLELEIGQLPRILQHSRQLGEILEMFSAEYWEEKAKEEIRHEIRKHLPRFP